MLQHKGTTAGPYLVEVESALHELRPEGILLLAGVQLAMAVQEALGKSTKSLPEGKVVPVGLLGCQQVSCQYLHTCT